MPQICPICSKLRRSNQSAIECTNCLKWVHHKNKSNCSGLTDKEFSVHLNEVYKIWLCDNCVHSKNFEILTHLPFFGLPDDSVVTGNPPINSNASNSVATRYKEFLSQCSQFETSIVQFNGDDHTDDVHGNDSETSSHNDDDRNHGYPMYFEITFRRLYSHFGSSLVVRHTVSRTHKEGH